MLRSPGLATASDVERYVAASRSAAAEIAGLPRGTLGRQVRSVCVLGAGTMGRGIAISLANAGLAVTIVDSAAAASAAALDAIRRTQDAAVAKGRIDAAEAARRVALVTASDDAPSAVAAADLVIEAVFEDLAVKREVFAMLDAAARPGAILATNTSTLDVNCIARFTRRPQDVVGLHFFSPANVMRLLEIVRGAVTADDVLVTVMELALRMGKVGVVAGVCDGFIGNRLFEEYLRQAYFLMDEGASPWQIDAALERFGMAMGPLAVMDLAGQDIGWSIRRRRAIEQPDRPYSRIPDLLCEMGRLGQKTGRGYYRYDPATRAREPDPQIEVLIRRHRSSIAVPARAIGDDEIVSRCVLALVNEGARVLGEGVAQRASDIDVVYLNGYGFPASRGGPMWYADALGLSEVVATMAAYRQGYQGWCWEPAALLEQCAATGRSISAGGASRA